MVAAASGRSAPSRGTPYDAYLAQGFRAAGLEPPPIRVATFSLPLVEELVASGRFVTALPSSMVRFSEASSVGGLFVLSVT
jgi:DNA-binding transcriptional LysR family regulator